MVARTGLFVAPLPGTTPQGTSPTDGRLVLGALFGTGPGCLSGGGITASATAMQVTVAQSVWRIPDPTNAAGVYLSPADAVILNFSAGPASGSRIDIVWVRQNNFEASDADSRVTYGVTAGTAASSPVAPAIPAGAMRIATLTVPTGAANAAACTLALAWPQTVAQPNLVCVTSAQLPAAGAFYGQLASVAQASIGGGIYGATYRWNGAAWALFDTEWIGYTPAISGLAGTNGGSPGWVIQNSEYRYTAGKVRWRGALYLNGSTAAAVAQISMPLPTAVMQKNFPSAPYDCKAVKNSTGVTYQLLMFLGYQNGIVYLGSPNGTNGATTPTSATYPFTWGQTDSIGWELEYDPA